MSVSLSDIQAALRQEDNEGLIAAGAPEDEYDSEAKDINSALMSLKPDQRNQETFIAVIALVWAKFFNRSPQEIEERMPVFKNLASRFLMLDT